MEINILTEILFGFGVALACGMVATGLRLVLNSFRLVADAG